MDHPVFRSFQLTQLAVRLFNEDFEFPLDFLWALDWVADSRLCPNDFELHMNIYLKQEDAPDAHEMAIKNEIVIKGWK